MVDKFVPGQVYQQGNISDFIKMTGWEGSSVLYFGDHVFTDLAVSFLHRAIPVDLNKIFKTVWNIPPMYKKMVVKLKISAGHAIACCSVLSILHVGNSAWFKL